MESLFIERISHADAARIVVEKHYLHRRPPMRFAFGLYSVDVLVGVCCFGTPPSRHLQKSLCPSNPSLVIELNRLWVEDSMPRNTESFFVAACLKLLPPLLVCSYADTAQGHKGYVYRAGNWNYSGMTDQDRKTPRYDYVPKNGKHSRDAFRSKDFIKIRRKPKHKYWLATGNRKEKRALEKLAGWPKLEWAR